MRNKTMFAVLSMFLVFALWVCPDGKAVPQPTPDAPWIDKTALIYVKNGDLVLATINSLGSIRKSVVLHDFDYSLFDVAIDRRNGRKDIYIVYFDANRTIFEMMTIPNNDFSQRTVQTLPFTHPMQVLGLRIELGTDSTNKVMPVVVTLSLTDLFSNFPQYEIELAYRVNQVWNIIKQPPYLSTETILIDQELGLSLDEQNGVTIGANLVFQKWDAVTITDELFTTDYQFHLGYGVITNPPKAISGSLGLNGLSGYLVSESNLIVESLGSFNVHCSSRNSGQWRPLVPCNMGPNNHLVHTRNIFGAKGNLFLVPTKEEVNFATGDLKLTIFDLSGINPVINQILLERVHNGFSLSINKPSLGALTYKDFYISAIKNLNLSSGVGNLVLYTVDYQGRVKGPILIEAGSLSSRAKILALD